MRTLVVDDDYVSRLKIKAIFSQYGDCDAAANGALALELLKQARLEQVPYELVTMDVNMPDASGQEVVRSIRAWEEDVHAQDRGAKPAKILMVSVAEDGPSIFSSFREGAEWFLVKPVTPEKVEEALKRMGIVW